METSAEDIRVLVGLLRLLGHRTQEEMAAAAKIHYSTLSRFEDGLRTPDAAALEKLARAAGVPTWAVHGVLLPAIALARALAGGPLGRLAGRLDPPLAEALAAGQSTAASAGVAEFLAAPEDDPAAEALPPVAGAAGADNLDPWTLAAPAAPSPRPAPPERYLDYEALCDRLCAESAWAASDNAARSLELACMALRVAELAPTPDGCGPALEGTARAFVGNALRVGSDLPAAAASFATAWRLWRAGPLAPGSRLAEWRLLDLEASLRRDQRRFDQALDLLERALVAAPPTARGRILLKKAFTLEQAGDIAAALATLEAAAPLVEGGAEPHHSWTLRINRLVLLCHLGRYAEAEAGLPELGRHARQLGNDLDQLRARWLAGRVWAGLGRRDEAREAFEKVRREFTERHLGYDAALVSLELAILHLEAGRTVEVRDLASEMLSLFTAQHVGREALAALSLFREAAESEALTVDLVRGVLAAVERARAGAEPLPSTSG
ncbi:MAG TPA: helix-turn-helix transcriptional regulator [Thermoanaerobaculia bacterium]|nr:helix-turn-helix transcriptional regulator [Thermoanaerobaculia bacterium]